MPKFIYEAKKSPTEHIKGSLVADTKAAAIQKISQMGLFLVSIGEEDDILSKSAGGGSYFFYRVSLKDITDFTRQLSDLLESGLTIVKALEILYNQTGNKTLKKVIEDVREVCVSGKSLSEALARHPKVFSNLFVSMIRSGETGGAMENILMRLSDFNEKQLDIQTKIKTALAYPVLMSLVGLATIIVLMTFVIPKMTVMFSDLGQAMPLPTQALLLISGLIRDYWWLILGFVFAIAMTVMKVYKTRDGRLAIDKFKLNLPIAGQLTRKVEIARFSRTLATLLENGVPILESLKVVSETIENALMRRDIEETYNAVREGSSLANGLHRSQTIPPAVINMISIGEEGGHLEKSLFKVAQGYERESDEAIKIMMSLLEPLIILTLGLVVGFIVIAMLLPIFEINFLMG
ncbi:MAG: type II secretion system F family protein [Candidatus Omnitrophota bacterium]